MDPLSESNMILISGLVDVLKKLPRISVVRSLRVIASAILFSFVIVNNGAFS